MRKILLMSSALVVSGLLSGVAEAACIQTPTCSSLGYTSSSSCTGGTKCPFGNAWNCTVVDLTNKITEITNKITTIEEKITEIEENGGGSGGDNSKPPVYEVGEILYSDMTASKEFDQGKVPIGVVFDSAKYLAVATTELKADSLCYTENLYKARIQYYESGPSSDWNGKSNTEKIASSHCIDSKSAVRLVLNYYTMGTEAGDWYLPSAGELNAIYKNRDTINKTLEILGGTKLSKVTGSCEPYWSSTLQSPGSNCEVWLQDFTSGKQYYAYEDSGYHDLGYGYYTCGLLGKSIARPIIKYYDPQNK